jgi:hypothetical protein
MAKDIVVLPDSIVHGGEAAVLSGLRTEAVHAPSRGLREAGTKMVQASAAAQGFTRALARPARPDQRSGVGTEAAKT